MNRSIRRMGGWAALGLLLVLSSAWTLADPAPLPFETGFEETEGYAPGPLPENSAWLVEGNVEVINSDPATGSQCLLLNPGQPLPRLRLNTQPHAEGNIVFVDFFLKAAAAPDGALPDILTAETSGAVGLVEKSATEAEIYAVDGDGEGGGQWTATGVVVPIADGVMTEWVRLSYRLDYTAKTWDLYVGGTMRLADMGFVNDTLETFQRFSLRGDPEKPVLLDNLYIGVQNLLFVDTSRDGLPDEWAVAHGFDPALNNRYGNPTGDGVSNLRKFLLGLDPNTPMDLIGAAVFPFHEDFESYQAGEAFGDAQDWNLEGSGSALIESVSGAEGANALALQGGGPGQRFGLSRLIDGRNHDVVWVDMLLQPDFTGEGVTVAAPSAAAAFVFDSQGDLNVFRSGQWEALPEGPRPLNLPPVESGAWNRLTVRLNYPAQSWSVWINGVRAGENIPFAQSSEYFRRFAISSDVAGRVDDIRISDVEPAGLVEPVADTEPPTTPEGLRLTLLTDSAVAIRWEPSTDNVEVASYHVYRNGTFLGQTTDTHWSGQETIAPGQTVNYAVIAVDTWGNESTQSEVLAVTRPQLLRSGTGLRGGYYDRLYFEDEHLERIDPQINFEWPSGTAPDPALNHQTFTVRWSGFLEPEFTGAHTLQVTVDPGVRLWVDGQLVIDHWNRGGAVTESAEVELTSGRLVPIVLEYFHDTGAATVHFQWKPPLSDQSVTIPSQFLYPGLTVEDTVPPDAPQGLHAAAVGDNDILLAWEQPADNVAIAAYRVFRDGEEVARALTPQWRDEGLDPAHSYAYSVKAEDFAGNLSTASDVLEAVTEAGTLPGPWRHRDVGPSLTRGTAEYNAASGRFTVSGAGRDIFSSIPVDYPDEFHFVYQKVQGDVVITARLDSFDTLEMWAKAGVMIRDGLGGYDKHFTTLISHAINAQLIARTAPRTATWNSDVSIISPPFWVRVTRVGDSFLGAFSADGVQWHTVSSRIIPMNEEVYVGMAVCGHHDTKTAPAVFSSVTVSHDVTSADVSGISDGLDSDGDGISDWEETHLFFTDPNVQDIWVSSTVAALSGSQGTSSFGSWKVEGDSLISQTVKAAVDYTVEVTEPGIYRIEFELAAGYNDTNNQIFPVIVSIDGQLLERFDVFLAGENTALIHTATPWLEAGSHTIRLYFDNTMSHRSLKVLGMRLQRLGGLNPDENGIPDWMRHRLDVLNRIASGPESFISPACVEGNCRYQASFHLLVDGAETPVQPAPGFGWYANVDLDPDAPVEVVAKFDNGGKQETRQVVWKPFNFLVDGPELNGEPLRVRRGDSLLLTAHPDDEEGGSAIIEIAGPDSEVTELEIQDPGNQPTPHLFDVPGTYVLNATFTGPNGSVEATPITVEVIEARFNGDPVTRWFPPVVWDNPLIPGNVLLVADQGLGLEAVEPLPAGGTRFNISSGNPGESYVVARLGENGPIADHAVVYSQQVASNENTAVDILEVYEDGSQLVGVPVTLSHITPDTRVEVEIFVNGVTFEDGTVFKVFTAEDFDAFGRIYLKFIRSAGVTTSICHRIKVYEGDTYLGTF